MSDNENLTWADLNKMSDEVLADDGPGSTGWNEKGTVTERVNEAFIKALRENNGKVPGELEQVPALIITTIGAKSGAKRSVPLAYQEIDGRLLIIASMAGSKRNPPWYHNLVANPEVVVEKDGETFTTQAVVTQGDDRDQLFAQICANFSVFADYQARTERTIPVVELVRQ